MTARVVSDHWTPKAGTELAKGRDWPQTHGPALNMAATDCGQPMINKIEDARLLWVSEEPIAGGKGNVNKTAFGVGPLTPNDIDGGDYCAPTVYDGRVYLFYVMTDFTAALNDPGMTNHILHIRGSPPGSVALGHYVHRYLCVDARTGKTLWRKDTPVFLKDGFKGEKGGVAQTPAIVEGVLVHRNGGTLVGMDPADGKTLWTNPKCGAAVGAWSHENSVVGIGGVVLAGVEDNSLVGFDPKTGAELWRQPRVRGANQIPSLVTLDGKPYILSALSQKNTGSAAVPTAEDQRLVLIEPKTGAILWEDKTVGVQFSSMAVVGDLATINITPFDQMKDYYTSPRVGAYRITLNGAQRLWENPQVNYYRDRNTPAACKDRIVLDSAETGFAALDAATGAIRGQDKHIYHISGGDHNWTWHAITDGKVVTSGLLLFDLYPELKRAEGQLKFQAASGYACPVKPAIADGRLFIRGMYHLVCYDLRASPAQLKVEAALRDATGKPEAEVTALCALMQDVDVEARYQAAQALVVRASRGGAVNASPAVRQALAGAVTEGNPALNESISKALGTMSVEALPELQSMATSGVVVARAVAMQTVGRIGGKDDARISEVLSRGLGDEAASVRLAAAQSAEKCLPVTAGLAPLLSKAVDDESDAVGRAAVRSLLLALPSDAAPAVAPKRYGDRLALLLDLWQEDALLNCAMGQIRTLGDDETLRVAMQVLEGDSALRGIRACALLKSLGPKAAPAIPKIEAARWTWAGASAFMSTSLETLKAIQTPPADGVK
jgi:outer membrane protein assembly factor BamB